MNARILLNAGGAGTRMGGSIPKPLVEVLGLSLIERNLLAILGAGARDVVLVVPATCAPLVTWGRARAEALCAAVGARFSLMLEHTPRGTGACLALAELPPDTDLPQHDARPILLLYADNLTALDLVAFDHYHAETGADITLAVHEHPFRLPFGRIRLEGERVLGYDEKPVLSIPIASGAYLFSPQALRTIPPTGRLDVPELVRARLDAGLEVRSFAHSAPWIDVNDPATRVLAEQLVANTPALECFCPPGTPRLEVSGAVLTCGDRVLLEWRPTTAKLYPAVWDTPGGKLEPGESAEACIQRELAEELGIEGLILHRLTTFDDLEPHRGWVRHHVFHATLEDPDRPRALEGQRIAWHPLMGAMRDGSTPLRRSMASFQKGFSDAIQQPSGFSGGVR